MTYHHPPPSRNCYRYCKCRWSSRWTAFQWSHWKFRSLFNSHPTLIYESIMDKQVLYWHINLEESMLWLMLCALGNLATATHWDIQKFLLWPEKIRKRNIENGWKLLYLSIFVDKRAIWFGNSVGSSVTLMICVKMYRVVSWIGQRYIVTLGLGPLPWSLDSHLQLFLSHRKCSQNSMTWNQCDQRKHEHPISFTAVDFLCCIIIITHHTELMWESFQMTHNFTQFLIIDNITNRSKIITLLLFLSFQQYVTFQGLIGGPRHLAPFNHHSVGLHYNHNISTTTVAVITHNTCSKQPQFLGVSLTNETSWNTFLVCIKLVTVFAGFMPPDDVASLLNLFTQNSINHILVSIQRKFSLWMLRTFYFHLQISVTKILIYPDIYFGMLNSDGDRLK